MANSKQAKFIVDVSAESKHTRKSSVRFFSYDSKTAEIVIQAEKDNELIPRGTISNVEIYFESVNSSYRPTESLKWNDQMTINDDDLFLYTLTDDLLNYQGLVAFEVYINYINNDKSDSSNRIIYEQRTSAIDRATGEIEIVYIKDMETAKKEVADKAAEVKESLAGYDSGLDIYADQKKTEMDNFTRNVQETSINEITKIQNELPKVKQVNVDETKKIKAEYPIVEQVATTEKEKIRAVLSTVDQTASEVSAYADRKISEYDAKFTQSNQKMNDLQQSQTALTTKLTETQQKITDADVFTKAESSVNVINQIGGAESAVLKKEFLVNGVEASGSIDVRDWAMYSRNYAIGTYESKTLAGNGTRQTTMNTLYQLSDKLLGKKVTVSFEVEKSKGATGQHVMIAVNKTWQIIAAINISDIHEGEKTKISVTATIGSNDNGQKLYMQSQPKSEPHLNGSITISDLKIGDDDNWSPAPEDSGMVSLSNSQYNSLISETGVIKSETLMPGRGAGINFQFNVIDTLEKKYPYIFEGLSTDDEKIDRYLSVVKKETFQTGARGGGLLGSTESNYCRVYYIDKNKVTPYESGQMFHSTNDFKQMQEEVTEWIRERCFDGSYTFQIVSKQNENTDGGRVSDGVVPAWIEVKDIRLIIELEVNGRTIIEEMIAAYCRPLEQQINDLAQKVAAMENK